MPIHYTTELGAVNIYQLHGLAGQVNTLTVATQQVLQIATGTMVLSGLNLAVTPDRFACLAMAYKVWGLSRLPPLVGQQK